MKKINIAFGVVVGALFFNILLLMLNSQVGDISVISKPVEQTIIYNPSTKRIEEQVSKGVTKKLDVSVEDIELISYDGELYTKPKDFSISDTIEDISRYEVHYEKELLLFLVLNEYLDFPKINKKEQEFYLVKHTTELGKSKKNDELVKEFEVFNVEDTIIRSKKLK